MVLRFVNASILVLILLLILTGVYGIVWRLEGWAYDLHRILGWGLIILVPWKSLISYRSLERGFKFNFDRGIMPILASLLSGATLLVILLGWMWAWRVGPVTLWLSQSVISWHWILALVLMPPFLLHAWQRWPRPKQAEFLSRQGFLRLAGLAALSAAGWSLSKSIAASRQKPSAPRAVTGSRLDGYLSGNDFPVTNSAGDGALPIGLESWELSVVGAVEEPLEFNYAELIALARDSALATIDCTVGWYSVQRWQGIQLLTLLNLANVQKKIWGVSLRAAEGYTHNVPVAEMDEVLLATHVGGEPLAHRHGFPLRAVVPSRRGWFWVKWLQEIEALV